MITEFFELILSTGPFVIFAGMGQIQNSGKLLFKGLTSSDGTVIISEDQTSITFSSNASGISIPQNKIVYGTGTGITSSIFGVDNRSNYEAITGAGNIVGNLGSKNDNSTLPTICNNLNVGGLCNQIYQVGSESITDNVILGGFKVKILSNKTNVKENVIISGVTSSIEDSFSSVIVASEGSKIGGVTSSRNASIIGSGFIEIYDSLNSSILSSCILIDKPIRSFSQSTVISSTCFCAGKSTRSTMISSYGTYLGAVSVNNNNNTIISSSGTQSIHTVDYSNYSTLSSTFNSRINRADYSSIFSSKCGSIYAQKFEPTPSILIRSCIWDSSIFSGNCNTIFAIGNELGTSSICSSSILSGYCNSIVSFNNGDNNDISIKSSVIVTGECNLITTISLFSQPSDSIIIGGSCNILGAAMSAILGGSNNCIRESCTSVILGGTNSIICKSKNSAIVASHNSKILRVGTTLGKNPINSVISSSVCSNIDVDLNNQLLSGECNCIKYHGNINCNNAILGGCQNTLSGYNSLIVGGNQNCLCQNNLIFDSSSLIIGGKYNRISGLATPRDVIIGGYKNLIKDKTYDSVIIGGKYNNIDASNAVTVGGCGLTNSTSNSAMFSDLLVNNLFFVNGVTGFSGTWTSGSPISLCSRGGIITIY